jgi:hypothetical protein
MKVCAHHNQPTPYPGENESVGYDHTLSRHCSAGFSVMCLSLANQSLMVGFMLKLSLAMIMVMQHAKVIHGENDPPNHSHLPQM